MPETTQASSRRILVALATLVLILMAVGAVTFVRYVRRNAPNPHLIAVAPVDIFVAGLDRWRVGLADALTQQLDTLAQLDAVPQTVVAQMWGSAPRPEISAVEVARRTGAGLAVYARVDSLGSDSVKVSLLGIDAATTKVLFGVMQRWPAAEPDGLAAVLAEQVRDHHPLTGRAASDTLPSRPR